MGIAKKTKASNTIIIVCLISLCICIVWLQKKAQHQIIIKETERLNYLPSGSFLKSIALGYDEAFADFLWVRSVGYFGLHVKTDRDFTWLTHMLKLVAALDPMYESPYEFAGIILPTELESVDEGMAFLEAGIENIPKHNSRYWLQPFYLGICYMLYKNDPLQAAKYLEEAATYPQSPGYLPLLVSRLYARANQPGVGIDIIQNILDSNTSNNKQKLSFDSDLRKRMAELIITENISMLENSVHDYISLYGKRPSQLGELVDGLILPFIPEDPLGGSYFLSTTGTHVWSTTSKAEFKIHGVDN